MFYVKVNIKKKTNEFVDNVIYYTSSYKLRIFFLAF